MPELSREEISHLEFDFFAMISTSAALFNSFLAFAGSYVNARFSTQSIVPTTEIIAHKIEGIRQINLALAEKNLPDAVLLAIMQMARLRDNAEDTKRKITECNMTSPFKPLVISLQWHERQLADFTLEEAHFRGIEAIVSHKGGTTGILSPTVSKTLSQ
jgi:hypothetical protein